jgi:hypothetical protein
MTSHPSLSQCGALGSLALLFACETLADDALRDEVHRQYKHQSYMLVEDADGAWLYLLQKGGEPLRVGRGMAPSAAVESALEKTRSTDAGTRVLGLTELAGIADTRALDTALVLLSDDHPAVREEAAQLILDHPQGTALATAMGIVDESEFPEYADGGQ